MPARMAKLALALAFIASGSLALAQASAPAPTHLRIGVEGAYPPFSEVGADGQLKGFEIELARALCAQMQAECTLVQQDFDGAARDLNARHYLPFDAFVSAGLLYLLLTLLLLAAQQSAERRWLAPLRAHS